MLVKRARGSHIGSRIGAIYSLIGAIYRGIIVTGTSDKDVREYTAKSSFSCVYRRGSN